ncbi:hypothetical protein H0H87_001295 [Tephrocybe sp. NHM501043]|nr:hypothetical protein H0H87_001295 [Tephrocybe sp. NHM501043]
MFPRGPRFEPQKRPGSYDVAAETQLDDYKRGAFLEKAGRFSKEKDFQVPGPETYVIEPKKKILKPSTSDPKRVQSQTLTDRYAILQRKVDDLEKVHNDGKKAHQIEVDHLKAELSRYQKLTTEQTERGEKQKKQVDSLELRIQELKKTAASDKIELKDLQVKLRLSEHGRTQLVSKQGEASEAKKSLQSLETKRRDELRERDRRILELEKVLSLEKKRKEAAEGKLQDIKGQGDEELQAARTAARKLEDAVAVSQAEATKARDALSTLQESNFNQEEELLAQLEYHRNLVGQVAEEYGRLAHGTVSLASHTRLRHENAALALQISRLERKLANSVAQVDELAFLIRQTNEQKAFLSQRLRDVELEVALYQSAVLDSTSQIGDRDALLSELIKPIEQGHSVAQQEVLALDMRMGELYAEFHKLAGERLLLEHIVVGTQLKCEQQISEQHSTSLASALASHKVIAARLEHIEEEKKTLNEELKVAMDLADSLKSSSESLVRRATEAEEKMADAAARNEANLKRERDAVRRLTDTVQKSRMAEDALRAEIEQLTAELTDAEKYQEAYYSLSDEVGSLVARNHLAEDEAKKLSKFNAEILGHNNPAQRIMYVDRIRRELAETKHKLAMLNREQDAAVAVNEDLQHELDMYKSVMVPADNKPRTAITRVIRPPLLNLTRSLNASSGAGNPLASVTKSGDSFDKGSVQRVHVLESIPGDMTIDEIM